VSLLQKSIAVGIAVSVHMLRQCVVALTECRRAAVSVLQ